MKNMDVYLTMACELGYLRKHGEDQFTITDDGQNLICKELAKPKNLQLSLQILGMPGYDERGSAYIGVLVHILRQMSKVQ